MRAYPFILCFLLLFSSFTLTLKSQTISKVQFWQEGAEVMIRYTLSGSRGPFYDIQLFVSTDGGDSFTRILSAARGDVGKRVSPGTNKKIIWNLQGQSIMSEQVVFEVRTKKIEMPGALVFVKGGTFEMGSTAGDPDEKPIHAVELSDFYIGKYEVTVADFATFVRETGYVTEAEKTGYSWARSGALGGTSLYGANWKHDPFGKLRTPSPDRSKHPVIHVNWDDASEYCKWLARKTGLSFRLPTEAEWEYAASEGKYHSKLTWGSTDKKYELHRYANYCDQGCNKSWKDNQYSDGWAGTAPVGTFSPNALGIYDMHGNVMEWCADYFAEYSPSSNTIKDPKGPYAPKDTRFKVTRGGSWDNEPYHLRVANRGSSKKDYPLYNVGFRICLSAQ